MGEANDFDQQIIEQFRANDSKVGGPLESLPLVLLHHTGAKSGTKRVNPLAWGAQKEAFPNFAEYETTSGGREIPAVLLDKAT
jgi:hypothetical protein